jgi:hypothetical protein
MVGQTQVYIPIPKERSRGIEKRDLYEAQAKPSKANVKS